MTSKESMKVVGIIPARYASTRFEGKALADLCGKPMIQHVYERSKQASSLDDVIVATDDERIFTTVKDFGGKVVMTSPEHPSGTDRIAEVARSLDVEVVVNIQGDEPLIQPAMIDEVVAPFMTDPSIVVSTLKRRIDSEVEYRNPNVVKVVTDENGFALYFSRSPLPCVKSGSWTPDLCAYIHVGLYAYRKQFLLKYIQMPPSFLERTEGLEQLRILENGYRIKVVETDYVSIGVDTIEDLHIARNILMSSKAGVLK